MPYALEGIRVIDMAQMWAAPGASMYMADQGAEVIKVEPRLVGDQSRGLGTTPWLGKNSKSYMAINRNKRSITVDIRKPEGREIIIRLVRQADVLIENNRPGVSDRLGLGYDALSKVNPRLIYGSVSGYGTKGPYAEQGAYDRVLQGLSGAMHRRLPDGTPLPAGVWIADCSVPMLMAYGVMLALWVRERTGRGQKVDTSLLQAAVAMQSVDLVRAEDDPTPIPEAANPAYGAYQCADGVYINVTALADHQFARLLKVMDLEHLTSDPRMNDPLTRNDFRNEVYPLLDELFTTRASGEWLSLLHAADIPAGPILDRAQVFDEPQIVDNEMLVPVQHPAAGRVRILGVPVRLSETPGAIRRPAPQLSEHTDEVLGELGYSAAEIAQLRAEEVI